jgi:radical SAM superfamily enzyme YgiQ (UPF0313 family)
VPPIGPAFSVENEDFGATEGGASRCEGFTRPRPPITLAIVPDIVLTTLNAKYIHAAFGLRYLLANLGELQSRACLVEFDINQRPLDIAEVLLARAPTILGFGIYIWNVAETTEVIAAIKRLRPEITIVLGGPEVSYETEGQPIVELADYVITGEADLEFAVVCRRILSGERPAQKVILAPLPELSQLALPYDLYTEDDIAHRVVYIEASRGCPFTCEFCLSSLDIPVRQVPLDRMLAALEGLMRRGVRQFKFVDRTFNLNLNVSRALLQFFLERHQPGRFYHFEMIPDRLPEALRGIIAKFPPGALQFEVGIQSFNDEVCHLISRRQDLAKLEDNLGFLRQHTGVHIHADLIVGLPGETLESFGAGFDRLLRLGPQEIQVGILKRLRGTPIIRHDEEWQMRYHAHPPYEILANRLIDFATMQRLRRFARYWDLVGNSGNFIETALLLWTKDPSPFVAFLRFSDWLYERIRRTDSIALARLAEFLFKYLTTVTGVEPAIVAAALARDWERCGRRDPPECAREFLPAKVVREAKVRSQLPRRQARHLAKASENDGA